MWEAGEGETERRSENLESVENVEKGEKGVITLFDAWTLPFIMDNLQFLLILKGLKQKVKLLRNIGEYIARQGLRSSLNFIFLPLYSSDVLNFNSFLVV